MKTSSVILGALGGLVGAAFVQIVVRAEKRRRAPEEHGDSLTALAGEALRTGTAGAGVRGYEAEIPGEDELLQAGDPDVDALESAYVGDEVPGGDMSTPDQDLVDRIGRAYGVTEADAGELRATADVLAARDHKRR